MLKNIAQCSLLFAASPMFGASVDQSLLDIDEVHSLDYAVAHHPLLEHKLLHCMADGGFDNNTNAIKTFFSHHYVYSVRFIDYLHKVVDKIEKEEVAQPILDNIAEENGNYEEEDLQTMESHGIERSWFDKIPHKLLSKRFLESLEIDTSYLKDLAIFGDEDGSHAGWQFATFMLDVYEYANACEALATIGFAIEETVSKLYQFIYDGLKNHTDLDPSNYVFFPLHILIDDGHADLLKLAFVDYLKEDPELCKNVGYFVEGVLNRRSKMLDMVQAEIEAQEGHPCVTNKEREMLAEAAKDEEPAEDFEEEVAHAEL